MNDLEGMLKNYAAGDQQAAAALFQLVYDDLKQVAIRQLRHEPPGHTLQPTALVHEAYLRLIDQQRVQWQGKTHFLAVGAQAMRRILVDHARAAKRLKRGGRQKRAEWNDELVVSPRSNDDVLVMHDLISQLETLEPRKAKLVELRFFGGLTNDESAELLQVSRATVDRDWRAAKSWIRMKLESDSRL